jgi:competence protein ComEA
MQLGEAFRDWMARDGRGVAIGAVAASAIVAAGAWMWRPTPSPVVVRTPTADAAPRAPTMTSRLVDINLASAAELDALPGIGRELARRIVESRQRDGPFSSVDELRTRRLVSAGVVEQLRSRVRV